MNDWPEPPADRRLDPYRRAAARLMDGDEQVGVVVFRVTTWWRVKGPFGRRRRADPRELPEWALLRVAPESGLPDAEGGTVPADALDAELADWAAGTFRLRGRRFELRRLDEEETGAAHREYGWESG